MKGGKNKLGSPQRTGGFIKISFRLRGPLRMVVASFPGAGMRYETREVRLKLDLLVVAVTTRKQCKTICTYKTTTGRGRAEPGGYSVPDASIPLEIAIRRKS